MSNKEKPPKSFSPFSTNHPASSAYRVTLSPHEWFWTPEEQVEIARALVQLDIERQKENKKEYQ